MSYKDTLQLWVILYFPVLRVIIWRDHSFGIKVILKNKKQSKQTNKKHLNYRRYRKKKSYLTKSECLEITAAINLVQKDFLWIQLPRTQTTHYINIKKKSPIKSSILSIIVLNLFSFFLKMVHKSLLLAIQGHSWLNTLTCTCARVNKPPKSCWGGRL